MQGNATAGASGSRFVGSGAIASEGSYGYFWSASACNATYGYYLYFYAGGVVPQYSGARGSGVPLRCIQGFALCGAGPAKCPGECAGRNFGLPVRRLRCDDRREQLRLFLVGFAARRCQRVALVLQFGVRVSAVHQFSRQRVPPALHPRICATQYGAEQKCGEVWQQRLRATATSARARWPTRAATVAIGLPRRTAFPAGGTCTSLRASWTRRPPAIAATGTPCAASKDLRCAVRSRTKLQESLVAGASGYRHVGSGAMTNGGGDGYFWSVSPATATHGRRLLFDAGSVTPQATSDRGFGYPLRCIQEFTLCDVYRWGGWKREGCFKAGRPAIRSP